MVRKSIWIGIGAFMLAMLVTPNINPSNRETVLSGVSLAGSVALARDGDRRHQGSRVPLKDLVPPILDLDLDLDDDDGGDDADDDGPDVDDGSGDDD